MLKKILNPLLVAFSMVTGLIITLVLLLDWKEEWLYDKFGKERVLDFMKKFEPFITMEPSKGTEETSEDIGQVLSSNEKPKK